MKPTPEAIKIGVIVAFSLAVVFLDHPFGGVSDGEGVRRQLYFAPIDRNEGAPKSGMGFIHLGKCGGTTLLRNMQREKDHVSPRQT